MKLPQKELSDLRYDAVKAALHNELMGRMQEMSVALDWADGIERPAALMLSRAPKAGKRIFLERIRPLSFVFSFVITIVFSTMAALTMRSKLNRVSMVESLKSVE